MGGVDVKRLQKRLQSMRSLMLVLSAVIAIATPVGARQTLVFWRSGIQPETVEWLRSELFPEFEERLDVVIEDLAIGWGGPRSEKLTVAFAAGVAPAVIVGNGGQTNVIPLDRYFESW